MNVENALNLPNFANSKATEQTNNAPKQYVSAGCQTRPIPDGEEPPPFSVDIYYECYDRKDSTQVAEVSTSSVPIDTRRTEDTVVVSTILNKGPITSELVQPSSLDTDAQKQQLPVSSFSSNEPTTPAKLSAEPVPLNEDCIKPAPTYADSSKLTAEGRH